MHIALASDHAGFEYKERVKLLLIELGHNVEDLGTDSERPVDYPLFIRPLAEAVADGRYDRGIVFGGSGNGEAIVANRVPGVRCTLCWDVESARLAREHNDSNVLALGQRLLDFDEVQVILQTWLETPFAGGRHARRIRMIDQPIPARPPAAGNGAAPHRTNLIEEVEFICNACRQEFQVPIDISAGAVQELLEECPVCCHENAIFVRIDDDGEVFVSGDLHVTG